MNRPDAYPSRWVSVDGAPPVKYASCGECPANPGCDGCDMCDYFVRLLYGDGTRPDPPPGIVTARGLDTVDPGHRPSVVLR